MAKQDGTIEVEGIVREVLPGAQYIVEINEENFPNAKVRGYLGGKMRKHYIKILPGDIVRVVLSPYDLEKGRIVYRQTNAGKAKEMREQRLREQAEGAAENNEASENTTE